MRQPIGLVLAGILSLAGCKIEQRHEIYLSDLASVLQAGAKPTSAAARFEIELLSKETCERDADKLKALLARHVQGVADLVCEKREFRGLAAFNAKVPIIPFADGKGTIPTGSIMAIGAATAPNYPDRLFVDLVSAKPRFEALRQDVRSTFQFDIGKGEFGAVTLVLVNDLPEDQLVRGWPAYVNGKASIEWRVKLARREKVEVRLSDVLRDIFREQGAVATVSIAKASP